MKRKLLLAVLALVLTAGMAQSSDDYWLHIRVVESDDDGEVVKINMPIALIEQMLPMIETKELKEGKLRFEQSEIDAADLKAMWEAVRNSSDGEFVSIESRDENVRVAKSKGLLLIKIEDRSDPDDPERVDVKIPLTVVDGLLSGEDGDELNLLAGLRALRESGDGVLVTVNDHDDAVRIWVDNSSGGGDE